MIKKNKKGSLLFLSIFSILAVSCSVNVANANENISSIERISGKDRYDTSLNVMKYTINDSNDVINGIIASGEDFPDALSAGFLSSQYNAPLILSKKSSLPSTVENQLIKKNIDNIYLIGGEKTLSNTVKNTLSHYSKSTTRIAGKNRYSTSQLINLKIAELYDSPVIGDLSAVYNGNSFADALSATPFMNQYNRINETKLPLLAVDGKANKNNNLIFGGETSIAKYNEDYRLAGSDRYKTAIEIAKAYKSILNKDIDTIVLTSGEDFPDALCAGPLASKKDAAILLTSSSKLNKDTKEYIESNKSIKKVIIVGGENSVSKNIENELKEMLDK